MTEKEAFPWERLDQQQGQSPGGLDTRPWEVGLPCEGEHHHQEQSIFILRSITLKHSKSSKHCCERCELTSNFDIRVHLSEPSSDSGDGKHYHFRPSEQHKLQSRDGRTPHLLCNKPAGSSDKSF